VPKRLFLLAALCFASICDAPTARGQALPRIPLPTALTARPPLSSVPLRILPGTGPVRTEMLTLTGTGALPPATVAAESFRPIAARTETLTLTGTGALPRASVAADGFPPYSQRTETITITGTGELPPASR